MGTFSIWHWIVVLLVVVLLFGTRKLRDVGSDLGAAIRSFKKGLQDDSAAADPRLPERTADKETGRNGDDPRGS